MALLTRKKVKYVSDAGRFNSFERCSFWKILCFIL